MNKQRMIRMLEDANEAIKAAGFGPAHHELIGQLVLASAIDEAGSSIGMSLDKLEQVAQEIGELASATR